MSGRLKQVTPQKKQCWPHPTIIVTTVVCTDSNGSGGCLRVSQKEKLQEKTAKCRMRSIEDV